MRKIDADDLWVWPEENVVSERQRRQQAAN